MTPAIGFLGFGEVASHFSAALAQAGAEVLAYDLLLDQPAGLTALRERARSDAIAFVPLPDLTARAEIILSTVTTDVALAAARSCAPYLEARHTYIDLNATSPGVKREIASVVAATGAAFVEGAILPAVGVQGAKSQVLLCGPQAAPIARTLTGLGLVFTDFGQDIGKASSFKMLRSIFSKGLEALLIECLLAARRAGVEEEIWREIVATLDAASFETVGSNWVRTHATAHARRYHEMVQVEQLLRDLGLDPVMTSATAKLFERSTKLGLKDDFTRGPGQTSAVIAALDAKLPSSTKS